MEMQSLAIGNTMEGQQPSRCPQCSIPAVSLMTRMVREICGHWKCRQCLLLEDKGCLVCWKNNQNLMYMDVSCNSMDDQNRSSVSGSVKSSASSTLMRSLALGYMDPAVRRSVKSWLENHDFMHLDDDLEWLLGQYYAHLYDALVNEDTCRETIENGKRISQELQANLIQRRDQRSQEQRLQGQPQQQLGQHLHEEQQPQPPPPPPPPPQESQNKSKKRKRRHVLSPDNYKHIVQKRSGLYSCLICQREFKNRLNIRYHIACADASAGHKCETCGKILKSSSHLTYHMRTNHGGVKPYVCKVCDKSFAQSGKLKRHEMIHSGERPFKCEECNHSFTTKYNLKEHQNIHKNERPYQCRTCSSKFSDKNNLRRHELGHERVNMRRNVLGETGLSCRFCTNSFFTSNLELAEHLKHSHQDLDKNPKSYPGPNLSFESFSARKTTAPLPPPAPPPLLMPDGVPAMSPVSTGGNPFTSGGEQSICEEMGLGTVPIPDLRTTTYLPSLSSDKEYPVPPEKTITSSDFKFEEPKSSPSLSRVTKSQLEISYKQVRQLLKQVRGSEVHKMINSLTSVERQTLIRIMAHGQKSQPTAQSESCSEVSTPSKKEFLRRYKQQMLEASTDASTATSSSFSTTGLDKQLTLDDYQFKEFPIPCLSDKQMKQFGSFEDLLKNIQHLAASAENDDAPDKKNQVTEIKSTEKGLRKVSLFEDHNADVSF